MKRQVVWPRIPDEARTDTTVNQHGIWIDLVNPSFDELAELGASFGFDTLVIDALARPARRPGFSMVEDCAILVAYAATPGESPIRPATDDNEERIVTPRRRRTAKVPPADRGIPWLSTTRFRADQIQVAIRSDVLVTVRSQPINDIETVWRRWATKSVAAAPGTSELLYILLDTIVDTYMPILDAIVEDVGIVEAKLLADNIRLARDIDLKDLFRCKSDLAQLARVITPQRAAVVALSRTVQDMTDDATAVYFQDVADHLARLATNIDTYHDMLESTLNAYLVLVANNQNETMKRLTSLTILFGLPIMATTFFGINLNFSALENPIAYPLAMVLVAMISGSGALFLRRRRII